MTSPSTSTRTQRNDARIREAAARLAAVDGWTSLMFHHVAAEAGMSVRPVRERYPDRPSLAADLWRTQLADVLITHVDAVVEAADAPSPDGLAIASIPFISPTRAMLAIAELLVVSSFVPTLRVAIADTFEQAGWLTPEMSRTQAARRAYVISLSLGSLILARNTGFTVPDLRRYYARLSDALSTEAAPQTLPDSNASHLDAPAQFGTGDPAWEALLTAAMDLIGEVGFDSATVQQIARRAGRTEGLLFSHYPSKRALFTDAALRSVTTGYAVNEAYQVDLRTHYSHGITEAITIREFMKPGRERIRAFYLEQLRVSWHDPELSEAAKVVTDEFVESFVWSDDHSDDTLFTEQALGIGVLILAGIQPDSWALPFDVVTVPLLG